MSCCQMLETMDRGDGETYRDFIQRVLDRELHLIRQYGVQCRASGGREVLCNIAGNQCQGDVKVRLDVGVFGTVSCRNCDSPFMSPNPNCPFHEAPSTTAECRCVKCLQESRVGICIDGERHISIQNHRGTATFVLPVTMPVTVGHTTCFLPHSRHVLCRQQMRQLQAGSRRSQPEMHRLPRIQPHEKEERV
jgi:hypothetical protein